MIDKIPFVSIITVNYNGKHLLGDCFNSLSGINYPKDKFEIIMVDNGSSDGSLEYVKKNYPFVRFLKNNDNNYCRANNLAINKAKGEFVALINNDTIIEKDWLTELVKVALSNSHIGAVGSKILTMDKRIQSVGHVEFPNFYWGDRGFLEEDKGQYNKNEEVKSVSNCSVLYRKKALNRSGYFDEDFGMYMEDVDMNFRLRKNKWKIIYAYKSIIYHKLHGSGQADEDRQWFNERNRLLFIAKYFSSKLPEYFCGFGTISKISTTDLLRIFDDVLGKLNKVYGLAKTRSLIPKIQKSFEILDNFRQHCFRNDLEKATSSLKDDIISKDIQLQEKDKGLQAKVTEVTELTSQLKAGKELSAGKEELIRSLKEEIIRKDDLIGVQDIQIKNQYDELRVLNQEKEILTGVLRGKDILLAEKEEATRNKQNELSSIYNSETYRYLAMPLWKILDFLKGLKSVCAPKADRHKNSDICIAYFSAEKKSAKIKHLNSYALKITNDTQEKQLVNIKISLEYQQQQRSYFQKKISLIAKSSSLLSIDYDWDDLVLLKNGQDRFGVDALHKGKFNEQGLYCISAMLSDNMDRELDRRNIYQNLEI